MNNLVVWCEIPVTDMARAKAFYAEVLDVSFTDEHIDEMHMAMFVADPKAVSGALIKSNHYEPSARATVIYFDGGPDLSPALARAEAYGSKVIWPKTPIQEGQGGYFAQFMDSEGNRIGLYSAA